MSRASPAPANPPPASPMATALKWVGGIGAVVSLVLALVTFTRTFSEMGERARAIGELRQVAAQQRDTADWPGAWVTVGKALALADEGGWLAKLTGRLDADRRALRRTQEDVAMQWLRNVRIGQSQTFSDVVDPLLPVLNRGLVDADAVRRGDLRAHLGWAHYLKWRDGRGGGVDVQGFYRQALADDPSNVYAHAHWAHWLRAQAGDLAASREHFAAALAAGRERPYVRELQLAALRNREGDDGPGELVRLVNDMRKAGDPIGERARSDLYNVYYLSLSSREGMARVVAAAPPAEQVATLRALFFEPGFDRWKVITRDAALATLLEAAGSRSEALASWRALRATLTPASDERLRASADSAIRRLTVAR